MLHLKIKKMVFFFNLFTFIIKAYFLIGSKFSKNPLKNYFYYLIFLRANKLTYI